MHISSLLLPQHHRLHSSPHPGQPHQMQTPHLMTNPLLLGDPQSLSRLYHSLLLLCKLLNLLHNLTLWGLLPGGVFPDVCLTQLLHHSNLLHLFQPALQEHHLQYPYRAGQDPHPKLPWGQSFPYSHSHRPTPIGLFPWIGNL